MTSFFQVYLSKVSKININFSMPPAFYHSFAIIFFILLSSLSVATSDKSLSLKLLVEFNASDILHAKDKTIVPVKFTITNGSHQIIRIEANPGSLIQIRIHSLEKDGSKIELYPHNMKLIKKLPLMVGSLSSLDLQPGQTDSLIVKIPFQVFDYPNVPILASIQYCFMTQKNGALQDENIYSLFSSPISVPPHTP